MHSEGNLHAMSINLGTVRRATFLLQLAVTQLWGMPLRSKAAQRREPACNVSIILNAQEGRVLVAASCDVMSLR